MSNQHPARRAGNYFQVPLCAFAFGASDKTRLEAIISFAAYTVGKKRWDSLTQPKRDNLFTTMKQVGKIPFDFKKSDPCHFYAVFGADLVNVQLRSVLWILTHYNELRQFEVSFVERHGADAMVRLRADLVFDARDGTGITPRELAVLAAIFSVIGDKQGPVLITQERIRRRALGYKTQAIFDAELPGRRDGAKPLTESQLRSMLERLHVRKMFARMTYANRQTFYSHRMSDSQLRKEVYERKTYASRSKWYSRLSDNETTDAIRNDRASANGKPPPAPNATPLVLPAKINPEQVF